MDIKINNGEGMENERKNNGNVPKVSRDLQIY
jgi:hypothetical protein